MKGRVLVSAVGSHVGETIRIAGWLHNLRDLGKIAFAIVRDRSGILQCVIEGECYQQLQGLQLESVLELEGIVVAQQKGGGMELQAKSLKVIAAVQKQLPFAIQKESLDVRIDTMLDHRLVSLRNLKVRSIFEAQAKILQYMRAYFASEQFTEINTPKLIGFPTEGGSEVFAVKYYDRTAYLAQSPQFYKQMMVSVFERVYEIGHAYRAEKSNTSRHMSELVMIDVEMGFIESWRDVAEITCGLLRSIVERLWEQDTKILALWPELQKPMIPQVVPEVTVAELHRLCLQETGQDFTKEPDPSPIEERFICDYIKKQTGSDVVLITEFPSSDAKFYHYVSPEKPEVADRADLLFKGVEIATLSRRVSNYEDLIASAHAHGIDPKDPGLADYLDAFAYGMPAEGGFGLGLERVTQKIFDLSNVKEASLFVRDVQRLAP